MLLAWKAVGIWTYAGYILGFPHDTPESARRDIEIIKKEMPLDVLEFFFLTPLPGSEDHKVLATKGVPLDPEGEDGFAYPKDKPEKLRLCRGYLNALGKWWGAAEPDQSKAPGAV